MFIKDPLSSHTVCECVSEDREEQKQNISDIKLVHQIYTVLFDSHFYLLLKIIYLNKHLLSYIADRLKENKTRALCLTLTGIIGYDKKREVVVLMSWFFLVHSSQVQRDV